MIGFPRKTARYTLYEADNEDRAAIYRLRHDVYATELAQHPENAARRLCDPLDEFNHYLALSDDERLVGFVSITPPNRDRYSLDKYLTRDEFPFPRDAGLFEVRLLTVDESHRHTLAAPLLMYAALRWIAAHGGTRIAAMGRRDVMPLYLKAGFAPLGRSIRSGAVNYELMGGELPRLEEGMSRFARTLGRLEGLVDWRLPVAYEIDDMPSPAPASAEDRPCLHGGDFFRAIGDQFDNLDRRRHVINADVLDAWFPPPPEVVAAVADHLPWLLQTSPPTDAAGLIRAIATARGVPPACLAVGGGSSDLIFRAFTRWLSPASRVLILDPTYGEYPHVAERAVGCRVDRLRLHRADDYRLDPRRLATALERKYDLAIVVNPNNPTGRHVPRGELSAVLQAAPPRTRFWIDEAYTDYIGPDESLERFAAASENVVVCKSMSKVYALSGARAAYLCGPAGLAAEIRAATPPWVVSLPAQVAAVRALACRDYYRARYAETRGLRQELAAGLAALPASLDVVPGALNLVLFHLPQGDLTGGELVERCRTAGLFLRDASTISPTLGDRAVRVAVKDRTTNAKILEIIETCLSPRQPP